MDLNIKNLWGVELGGTTYWITQTVLNTWVIMGLLIVFAIVVRIMMSNFKEVPTSKFQNIIETLIEAFDNFIRQAAGEKLLFLGNWFFMVFSFVLVSNLSGIVGLRPPTADWATTFALAMATFILIQAMGIKFRGRKYIKSFFEPFFIFFPLNLIGELARPISLSFRLFGNILAGMILMSLLYNLAPIYVRFVIPAALHAYFDLFVGALQAYIFCVLGLAFIGGAASAEEA